MDERETGEQEKADTDVPRQDVARPGLLRTLWEWTRSLALTIVVFLVLRVFVVEAFRIPTASMQDTLLPGDLLLVNKAVYGAEVPGTTLRVHAFAEPMRGDLVVFVPPHDSTTNYVKRLVGAPGDTLEMHDKVLVRNGLQVPEPYVRYLDEERDAVHPNMKWQANHLVASTAGEYHPTRDNWGPIVVPAGEYFFLGDNRDNSEDSRYWGFVSREAIRGRPWFVYYSFEPTTRGRLPWLRGARWERVGLAVH